MKIFDFGLCKELDQSERTKDGLYKMTGRAGSRMYMAPEVCLCKPYDLTADVYSFGILLWQVFSLKEPFAKYTLADHMEMVVKKGYRPPKGSSWPKSIKNLMTGCWSENINKRPSFETIKTVLHSELMRTEGGDADYIVNRSKHLLRRSRLSMQALRMSSSFVGTESEDNN